MLMMWLLWEKDYKRLQRYLHHWSKKTNKVVLEINENKNTRFTIVSQKPYNEN